MGVKEGEFKGSSFEGYVLGKGNQPGEILSDKVALTAAEELRKKLSQN
jgi:hypothetical protein